MRHILSQKIIKVSSKHKNGMKQVKDKERRNRGKNNGDLRILVAMLISCEANSRVDANLKYEKCDIGSEKKINENIYIILNSIFRTI